METAGNDAGPEAVAHSDFRTSAGLARAACPITISWAMSEGDEARDQHPAGVLAGE